MIVQWIRIKEGRILMQNIDELVDLHECPLCEEDRLEDAKRAAELFNTGKVLKSNPGE